MNKWFYRAVGAVGVASGVMLVGSGVAHAETATETKTADPQVMRELVADLFSPTGGQHNLGLVINNQAPDDRAEFLPLSGLTGSLSNLSGKSGGPLGALPIGGMLSGGGGGPLGGLPLGGLPLTGDLAGDRGTLGALPLGGGDGGPLGALPLGALGGGDGGPLGALPLGALGGGDGGPLGALPLGALGGGDGGPLGALPVGGLLDGGPLGAIPLDALPIGGLLGAGQDEPAFEDPFFWADEQPMTMQPLGTPGPASTDIIDPALGMPMEGPTNLQLDPALARQVGDATKQMVPALIADALAQQTLRGEHTTEGLPVVDQLPVVGSVLGNGGPLDDVLVVGNLARNLPVASGITNGQGLDLNTVDKLPVVGTLVNQGLLKGGKSAPLPVIGTIPFLGDALAGVNLDQVTDTLPTANGGLNTLPASAGLGDLTGGLSGLSGLTGQQASAQPAPIVAAMPHQQFVDQPTRKVGRHSATERPIAGVDTEYAESLPLVGSLTGAGSTALPVSRMVRELPLINELPFVSELATPMQVLKAMPVVNVVGGILPVE